MSDVRSAWRQAYREARLSRATGRKLYGLIIRATGGSTEPFGNFTAQRFHTCLQAIVGSAESDRYRLTRDVLNQFGRLNPWSGRFRDGPGTRRDSARVRRVRAFLLRRRLIAPEPGGYVTGLLSAAPDRMWWHDYPRPVAPFNAEDLAAYQGSMAA